MFPPQVDLFGTEYTNRNRSFAVGPENTPGTADDVLLPARFNINPAFYADAIVANGQQLEPPNSYGVESGRLTTAQGRGIGTLPGGIPIFKTANGQTAVVGGNRAFFPGPTAPPPPPNPPQPPLPR